MAWVKGTSATNGTFSTTNGSTEAVTITVSAGQVVCATLSFAVDVTNNPTSGALTSSLGNTYTRIASTADTTNHQRLEVYLCVATVGGSDTITPGLNPVPGTTTALALTLSVDPFTSGGSAISAADGTGAGQNQVAPGTGTDAVSSGSWTTATDGDLIYAATVDTSTGADPGTHGTGFTDGSASSGATTIVTRTEFKTQTTHGSIAGTFTGGTGGDRFITAALAVKPAAVITPYLEAPNLPRPGRGPFSKGRFYVADYTPYTTTAQTYNLTITESGTGADAISSTLVAVNSVTETGSVADAISNLVILVNIITEAGSAGDSASTGSVFNQTITESGSAADVLSSVLSAINTITDSGSATDSASFGSIYSLTITETGVASDALTSALVAINALIEAGLASDTIIGTNNRPGAVWPAWGFSWGFSWGLSWGPTVIPPTITTGPCQLIINNIRSGRLHIRILPNQRYPT